MTDARIRKLKRKLQEARFRLLNTYTGVAMPLCDMTFVATKDVWRMSTNDKYIFFDPDWLCRLGDIQLDFILSHQLMHITLGHVDRVEYYKGDRFHLACDIEANAYLGRLGWEYEKLAGIGRIFVESFFPRMDGWIHTPSELMTGIPFDPAEMKSSERRRYMIDSDAFWDRRNNCEGWGTVVLCPDDVDPEDLRFDRKSTGGEGFLKKGRASRGGSEGIIIDSEIEECERESVSWESAVASELKSLRDMKNNSAGKEKGLLERSWQKNSGVKLDWRRLLNHFVQDDVKDYSFMPPDRRFDETGLFLPDYNLSDKTQRSVLFMVDTSGSVNESELSEVFSELCGALYQFDGALTGMLGFFDTRVYSPQPFSTVDELKRVIPKGGGGTDFSCVFDYIKNSFLEESISSVVIFTDGSAPFPEEREVGNVPVLWLFNNDEAVAPWGQMARI